VVFVPSRVLKTLVGLDAATYLHGMTTTTIAILALFLSATAALAEPLAIPRQPGAAGACPSGYTWQGSNCVPFEGASTAIPRPLGRACPYGWSASGGYCIRR
jgi:hypothetical protein